MRRFSIGWRVELRTPVGRCIALGLLLLVATAFADSDKRTTDTPRETDPAWKAALAGDANIIGEIAPSLVKLDFNSDGLQDLVAVVTGPVGESPDVSQDAFSYGTDPAGNNGRCLLVALHPTEKRTVSEGRRVWCGQSPILVLRGDVDPTQMGRLVKKVPRAKGSRKLPKHIRDQALGDALVLQTEGGESVIYLSKAGLRWEELPGAE
jgi:hypothetical protein